jgi:hypothetical protein
MVHPCRVVERISPDGLAMMNESMQLFTLSSINRMGAGYVPRVHLGSFPLTDGCSFDRIDSLALAQTIESGYMIRLSKCPIAYHLSNDKLFSA